MGKKKLLLKTDDLEFPYVEDCDDKIIWTEGDYYFEDVAYYGAVCTSCGRPHIEEENVFTNGEDKQCLCEDCVVIVTQEDMLKAWKDKQSSRVSVSILELKYSEIAKIADDMKDYIINLGSDGEEAFRMALEECAKIMVSPDCNFAECDHGMGLAGGSGCPGDHCDAECKEFTQEHSKGVDGGKRRG